MALSWKEGGGGLVGSLEKTARDKLWGREGGGSVLAMLKVHIGRDLNCGVIMVTQYMLFFTFDLVTFTC